MHTMPQTAPSVQQTAATASAIEEHATNARRAIAALVRTLEASALTLAPAEGDEDAEESLSKLTATIAGLSFLARSPESPRAEPSRGVCALLVFAGETLGHCEEGAEKSPASCTPRVLLDMIHLARKRLADIAPLLSSDLDMYGAHDWIQAYTAPFRLPLSPSTDDASAPELSPAVQS